jgi:hypothetical protein
MSTIEVLRRLPLAALALACGSAFAASVNPDVVATARRDGTAEALIVLKDQSEPMLAPLASDADYKARRDRLAAKLGNGTAILFASTEDEGQNAAWGFRQNDWFYYSLSRSAGKWQLTPTNPAGTGGFFGTPFETGCATECATGRFGSPFASTLVVSTLALSAGAGFLAGSAFLGATGAAAFGADLAMETVFLAFFACVDGFFVADMLSLRDSSGGLPCRSDQNEGAIIQTLP